MTRPALSAQRVAVIGDVGGHLEELRAELLRLGADETTGRLPPGLVVVQVGDLIHRGPDSPGVIALIDRYLTHQPDQWVQLVGNHEAQYLRAPAFEWPEKLDADTVTALRRWWAEGSMVVAVSFVAGAEPFLITHAGLTSGFWQRVLGGIPDPAQAAGAMNSFIGAHEDVLFHAGHMLGRGRADPMAGPIWAAAATELIPSWLGMPMPFSQVHGHTTIAAALRARSRGRRAAATDDVARLTEFDPATQHETTVLDGGRVIGVDPGHGRRPRTPWRAWEHTTPSTLHF